MDGWWTIDIDVSISNLVSLWNWVELKTETPWFIIVVSYTCDNLKHDGLIPSQINNGNSQATYICIITWVRPSGGGAYFQSSDRWAMGISHLLHYNLHSAQCIVHGAVWPRPGLMLSVLSWLLLVPPDSLTAGDSGPPTSDQSIIRSDLTTCSDLKPISRPSDQVTLAI